VTYTVLGQGNIDLGAFDNLNAAMVACVTWCRQHRNMKGSVSLDGVLAHMCYVPLEPSDEPLWRI
jgi:hypothetical protein